MAYCPSCGGQLVPTARFCATCGAAVPPQPVAAPTGAAPPAPPQRGSGRRILLPLIVGIAVAALVATGVYLLTQRPDDGVTAGAEGTTAAAPPSPGDAPEPGGQATEEPPLDGSCTWLPAQGGEIIDVGVPPAAVATSGTLSLGMSTNFGVMDLVLDRSMAPCAAASFEYLALQRFFDGAPCHRLTTSPSLAVLQCGDPSGTGTGGPAYRYAEEVSASTAYPRGTVAMAKAAAPSSTGSQFFLVVDDSQLPPEYTVVGSVADDDLDVLDAAAAGGVAGGGEDGAPATPVQVVDVDVLD